MTRRIFRSIVSVALLVLLACAALLLFVLYSYFGTVQAEQLQAELSFAAEGVETGDSITCGLCKAIAIV